MFGPFGCKLRPDPQPYYANPDNDKEDQQDTSNSSWRPPARIKDVARLYDKRQNQSTERYTCKHEKDWDPKNKPAKSLEFLELSYKRLVIRQTTAAASGELGHKARLYEATNITYVYGMIDIEDAKDRRDNRDYEEYAGVGVLGEVEAGDNADSRDVYCYK
jgi:hypothetical protein